MLVGLDRVPPRLARRAVDARHLQRLGAGVRDTLTRLSQVTRASESRSNIAPQAESARALLGGPQLQKVRVWHTRLRHREFRAASRDHRGSAHSPAGRGDRRREITPTCTRLLRGQDRRRSPGVDQLLKLFLANGNRIIQAPSRRNNS